MTLKGWTCNICLHRGYGLKERNTHEAEHMKKGSRYRRPSKKGN